MSPYFYEDVVLLSDILDDLERTRIANENRLRTLTRGDEWGKGAGASGEQAYIAALIGQIKALEEDATVQLERAVKASPLGGFCAATPGLGLKSLGRLLGLIGDPAWNGKEGRPRTLRELYAYCGLGVEVSGQGDTHDKSDSHLLSGVAPSRKKGVKANWSGVARARVYLIAKSAIMQDGEPDKNGRPRARSPYRDVYDEGRAKYADAVHNVPCNQCGPKGHPAQPGSPLSPKHQHARATRLVMKAFLKDLWRAAAHSDFDSQKRNGGGSPELAA